MSIKFMYIFRTTFSVFFEATQNLSNLLLVIFCRTIIIDFWDKMVYYIHITTIIFQKDKD